jgi:Cu+-exporting ATPase
MGSSSEGDAMERDPVCGAALRPGQEGASITYQGQTFHFCSADCKRQFERNPKAYMTAPAESQPNR